MDLAEVEKIIQAQKDKGRFIVELPEEVWDTLTPQEAKILARKFQRGTMVKLPRDEVEFFEWLREEAPEVWEDLWGDVAAEGELYSVGMGLLPEIVAQGFPICDLMFVPNFYFTYKHITPSEGQALLAMILDKVEKGEELSLAERFLYEVQQAPIDLWHFAYLYNVSVEQAKEAVMDLIEGGALRHTPTRDELSDYLIFEDE